ncbi:MAG TPA: TetR family transcriptional regulator [Candidatus Acidoferrales bacterium]|nr:TetR family transcriptional regulator [Candidatus Acidoferrales bacterium]
MIRDALKALLNEKNFESISVQDIAERATVNRATFYAHFQDKFALLDALIQDDMRAHLSQGAPMASDVRSMLLTLATNVFSFVATHRKCKIDRDFEPQFEQTMETEVSALLAPKFTSCNAHLVATALVGSAMRWRAAGCKQPADNMVREIVNALIDGVASGSVSS